MLQYVNQNKNNEQNIFISIWILAKIINNKNKNHKETVKDIGSIFRETILNDRTIRHNGYHDIKPISKLAQNLTFLYPLGTSFLRYAI